MIKFFTIWIIITLLEYHFGPINFIGRDNYYVASSVALCFFFTLSGTTVRFTAPGACAMDFKLRLR
jgi:hypothetical protein